MNDIKYTSNLNELNLKDKIIGWKCSECDQPITEENYKDGNYTLWFDENSENLTWNDEGFEKKGAKLTIWIDKVSHGKIWNDRGDNSWNDCPDVVNCVDCNKRFKEETMKRAIGEDRDNGNDYWYCDQCFNKKYGDYLKERAKRRKLTHEQKEVLRVVQKALTEHMASQWHKGQVDYSNCKGSECEGYKQTLESYGYERDK